MFMFHKLLIASSLLSVVFNKVYPPPSSESVTIKGYVEMVDLYEEVPFYLYLVDGHPVAYLDIFIYVDGVLALHDVEVSSVIDRRPYYIAGFTTPNVSKKIKIAVNYIDKGLPDSVTEFIYYTPSYTTHTVRIKESIVKDKNPYRVDFEMKGDVDKVKYSREQLTLKGNNEVNTYSSRFFDFKKYEIASKEKPIKINQSEFRIYKKFENSDLLYKNGYTSIELKTIHIENNIFKILDDKRFYINKENGGIYETYDSSCNDEAMSFFFPLSFDSNEKVRFQIVYYDVGYNHNDYIFEGYIFSKVITNDDFGGLLSYKYQEIEETLEVEYE